MAGRTVLIAEDDEHLRLLMRDLLQMEGYTVVEAQDALETVQALDAHGGEARFAVVLLDIAQSHDGLHVLGHMAGQRDRTPVIALSVSEEGLERGPAQAVRDSRTIELRPPRGRLGRESGSAAGSWLTPRAMSGIRSCSGGWPV